MVGLWTNLHGGLHVTHYIECACVLFADVYGNVRKHAKLLYWYLQIQLQVMKRTCGLIVFIIIELHFITYL